MNLYCTGGHITPALAVIDELQKKHPHVMISFFGREYSQNALEQVSTERAEIEKRGIDFIPIEAAKFHRTYLIQNVFEILKIPGSLWTVYKRFRVHPPQVIVSFGGYVALPVCILGKLFGARVITHEQTMIAGLANQIIALFADVVALSYPQSASHFFTKKCIVTGNPIREALLREYKTPPKWLSSSARAKPIVYVTGGSQGSAVINQTISVLLEKLTRDFIVVHQCGSSKDSRVQKDLLRLRDELPELLRERYYVMEWIEERDVSYLLRNALFVISRSGANTVQELVLAGTPAIFIPLPFAYNDEQLKNAQSIVQEGAALIIEQKDLLPDSLRSAITQMSVHHAKYSDRMKALSAKSIRTGTTALLACILQ